MTIISEDPLPDALYMRNDFLFQSDTLEADFTRIAAADVVLSNSSTMSQQAASIGKVLLGNGTRYFSLGDKENAAARLGPVLNSI